MSRIRIRFETLVQQAGQETVPPMDITDRVLASIGQSAKSPAADWPMWQAAAASVIFALAVLMLTAQQGALFEDLSADWLRSLALVMQ